MRIVLLIIGILFVFSSRAQNKKSLDHSVYDNWKNIKGRMISDDGKWISYQIDPQQGDGYLYIYNTREKLKDSIPRGYDAGFSAGNDFLVFKIKPQFDTLRQKKLNKVKKEDLPKDSLGIWDLANDSIIKFPDLKSFKLAEKQKNWLAFLYDKPGAIADTTVSDSTAGDKKEKKDKKDEAKTLKIMQPGHGYTFEFDKVTDYTISEKGDAIAFISAANDSIDSTAVHFFNTIDTTHTVIYHRDGHSRQISLDIPGAQLAGLFSPDTGEVKLYELFYWNTGLDQVQRIVDTGSAQMPSGWGPSEYKKPEFDQEGEKIFFGTAPLKEPKPEDTLTEDEKVSVDIWNWRDTLLQPHQQKKLKEKKKENFLAVYDLRKSSMLQLGSKNIYNIKREEKGPGKYAIGYNYKPYLRLLSWEASRYRDIYLVNLKTGEKKLILEKVQSRADLSPDENHVLWYDAVHRAWNLYDINKERTTCLSCSLEYPFHNIEFDMPDEPNPYGFAGWTENDEYVLIYDQYDIWKFDPRGKEDPESLTDFYGRDNKIRFRIKKLDPEQRFFDLGETIILEAFGEESKKSGYFALKPGNMPLELILKDAEISHLKKAKNAEVLNWNKGSFEVYPDLYYSNLKFEDPLRISVTNQQQSEYLWGTVEAVSWTSLDGKELDGLLYKPENFDPEKKYPMIVYFYETYSDRLHTHYPPSPSRSVINFTYYVSNGYLIFIPDIVYETGFPGQSAYDAIMSGTIQLARKPWVDENKIGLQGQSWGGYQVAYLVTQTDYFAAAMAGAPVSNMTSAYGGIRWGSGMSRMFQYEESQSRIGGTLWEKPLHYINNSPLFKAPDVETPLLIMHNDEDGAVPWYQGIELFVALRRLNKPVWMLTYNGAPHNLDRRADMKDLTKRMQQFFDHYLKDEPAPAWMVKGVPAIKKGREFGFELMKE